MQIFKQIGQEGLREIIWHGFFDTRKYFWPKPFCDLIPATMLVLKYISVILKEKEKARTSDHYQAREVIIMTINQL